jgi:hypothetical protein
LFKKQAVLLVLFSLLAVTTGYPQSRQVRRAYRKRDRTEQKLLRDYNKSRRETLKRRYNMQSDEVKKRMKAAAKSSRRWNNNRREPFYKRLLTRKRPKRRRR